MTYDKISWTRKAATGIIKDATNVIERIDKLTEEYRIDDCHELLQEAVYLQVAVNRLVWRLNEISNGRDD